MNPVAMKFDREHKARLERMGVPAALPRTPVVKMPPPGAPAVRRLPRATGPKPTPKPPIEDFGRPSPITSKTEVRKMVAEAAEEFGLFEDEIYSKQRNKCVVFARHVVIHRLRKRFPHWSFPQIGRAVGRDHTTVMYVLGRLEKKPKDLEAVRAAA